MIRVSGKKIADAVRGAGITMVTREYLDRNGLACRETKSVIAESDYPSPALTRISTDNGRSFGEWMPIEKKSYSTAYGRDERIFELCGKVWNPHYGHYVATGFYRYFLEGHEASYAAYWNKGARSFFDHQTVCIFRDGEDLPFSEHLVMYEEGKEFDPENPRDPEHLERNNGFENPPIVLKNGDIAVPVGVPVHVGCRIAGLDVSRVFPSCPTISRCVIVARGKYDPKAERYNFTFSNPIILGDLRSSRGIDEPILAELESGRLLLVMRGSNVISPAWNTRIEPGTPSFKWYSYSDNGGADFTDAEPWRFDDREVIYSGATISKLFRSSKNGKLYWFGNISDHTAYGNSPRYPLYVSEVDEKTGLLKKESLTVIDTRREGESEALQLSNFDILEDRESLRIELSLCKYGQFDRSAPFYGEGWRYELTVDAE
ncbi:MAG: exo-alpha-sialidase [Clostridia bacterium]|nr:exo-alpha-sialidase [Clostridia bacterium]